MGVLCWTKVLALAALLPCAISFSLMSNNIARARFSRGLASCHEQKSCRIRHGLLGRSLAMSGQDLMVDPKVFAAKSEVLAILSGVQDPYRGNGIVALAAVKDLIVDMDGGSVSLKVELGAPDLKGEVKVEIETALRTLPWVKQVSLTMAALPPQDSLREASRKAANGLNGVKNVVACASCKGGVGKSTTAVNLAFSLRAKGYKVGIFDVDIYGPSLPTMVRPERPFNPYEDIVGNAINPPSMMDVKLMSVGFINPQDSFVLRGAKISPLVQQLVSTTQWGDLDYLIIDMPPGTGDIHLTLSQMEDFKIDAAVIVTTPQRLSFIDVVKGVEMFDKVACISHLRMPFISILYLRF
jgi:Mrp family chromosome partitioning ATPase